MTSVSLSVDLFCKFVDTMKTGGGNGKEKAATDDVLLRCVRTSVGDRFEGYRPRNRTVFVARVRTLRRSCRLSREDGGPNDDDYDRKTGTTTTMSRSIRIYAPNSRPTPIYTIGPSRLDAPQRSSLFGDTMKTGVVQGGKGKEKPNKNQQLHDVLSRCVPTSAGDRIEGYRPRDLMVLAARVRTLRRRCRLSRDFDRTTTTTTETATTTKMVRSMRIYAPSSRPTPLSTVGPSRRRRHTIETGASQPGAVDDTRWAACTEPNAF